MHIRMNPFTKKNIKSNYLVVRMQNCTKLYIFYTYHFNLYNITVKNCQFLARFISPFSYSIVSF